MIFSDDDPRLLRRLSFCALLFVGFGLYISTPWSLYETWRVSRAWEEKPAVVTAIDEVETTSDYLKISRSELRVHYEYGFEGKRHKDYTRGGNLKRLRVGDTINVYVNPNKPNQSAFKRTEFPWNALLGLLCIVAGMWLGWRWVVKRRSEDKNTRL